jgi:hypothetical protein
MPYRTTFMYYVSVRAALRAPGRSMAFVMPNETYYASKTSERTEVKHQT